MRIAILLSSIFLAGILSPASSLAAGDVVISTGQDGGYYYSIGRRLRAVYLADFGKDIEVEASRGSIENLSRLADPTSKVNVALTQADALKRFVDSNRRFQNDFTVLTDVGKECVFLIGGASGKVTTAADLREKGNTLSVSGPASGAAITFEFMSRLEPAYQNTTVLHIDPMQALLQVTGGEYAKPNAMMFVQRPRTLSPAVEIILGHPENYRIIPIRPEDLKANEETDGKPIYSFETVKVGFGIDYSASFDTICTRGLLLAHPGKLGSAGMDELAKALLQSGSYILPGRDS